MDIKRREVMQANKVKNATSGQGDSDWQDLRDSTKRNSLQLAVVGIGAIVEACEWVEIKSNDECRIDDDCASSIRRENLLDDVARSPAYGRCCEC